MNYNGTVKAESQRGARHAAIEDLSGVSRAPESGAVTARYMSTTSMTETLALPAHKPSRGIAEREQASTVLVPQSQSRGRDALPDAEAVDRGQNGIGV